MKEKMSLEEATCKALENKLLKENKFNFVDYIGVGFEHGVGDIYLYLFNKELTYGESNDIRIFCDNARDFDKVTEYISSNFDSFIDYMVITNRDIIWM